jgi:hypothetical protein
VLWNKKNQNSGELSRGSVKRVLSLLALLALLAGLATAVATAAPASAPPGLAQAIAAKDRHVNALLAHPGVVGAGVGLENGQAVVVVLAANDQIAGLPASLDGVRVTVRVTGRIRALEATATRPAAAVTRPLGKRGGGVNPATFFSRPVPIGVSTGNADQCLAGTIAARVKSGSPVYALSNNHVYAEENQGKKGKTTITQPGLYDSGKGRSQCVYSSSYFLGTLSNFVPIQFSTTANNTVDAAIAATTTGNLGNATPSNGYGTPSSTTATAALNMSVQKYGRTTALTQGSVCMTDTTVNVSYSSGVARFIGQFGVCPGGFSQAGDSGSLIVTTNGNHPVGLLFAGGSGVTFANPIGDVLSALHVSIDGS